MRTKSTSPNEEDVTIGDKIEATRFGVGSCGFLLIPGTNFEKESWYPQAQMFAKKGYQVLTVEFTFGKDPIEDILESILYFRQECNVERLIIVGASSGGKAALKANTRVDFNRVHGTVAIAHPEIQVSTLNLHGKLLFVVGEHDTIIDVDSVKATFKNAPEPKELVMLESKKHAQQLFQSEKSGRLMDILLNFVESICEEPKISE
jgi:pimeloyl-ACP methyl ester carboxylesterase